MTATDLELLAQFIREADQSSGQDAFTCLVNRHLDLVYSAAWRQVRSPELAQEVAQTVFVNLARQAARLKTGTILPAWLYEVTRCAAIDVIRREARRQAREQLAFQMTDQNDNPEDWRQIEPLLDEAMSSLDATDRAAVLMRYFENKSLREVGAAIGASEDAAQKRVVRALDRLRAFFSRRKIAISSAALIATLSAKAVQAAPLGLAATIAAGATGAGVAAVSAAAVSSAAKTIAMTTIQKITITAAFASVIALGIYEARQASSFRQEVHALRAQLEEQAALSNELQELRLQRDHATNALAAVLAEKDAARKAPAETLKLRGEVGRLRREKTELGSSSPLSKVTADPESSHLIREQQKAGMGLMFRAFAKRLKLSDEQTEKLNDTLADYVMTNVTNVTAVLHDKPSPEQMNQLFAAQDAALLDKIQEQFGPEAREQFQEYYHNLVGHLTGEQFKGMLTGDDAAKQEKTKQLAQLVQDQVQAGIAAAGLPEDYQTIPILNFRNIASESSGAQSLKFLQDVYEQVAGRATSFLSPAEIEKFRQFTTTAIKNNRSALALNRTMMAPIGE